jgi:hypothetical protein
MATQLEKTYDCLTCKAPIKLARKDNGIGWEKYNLDGSVHVHSRQNNTAVVVKRSELADLQDQIQSLQSYVKTLVTQVQLMRQEVQAIKKP